MRRNKKTKQGIPFSTFGDSLKKGIGSLYAFVGRDRFLRSACVRLVCASAGGEEPCSSVEFDGSNCEVSAVFDEMRTLPLLEEKRLVCVENADAFIEACGGKDEPDKKRSFIIDRWPDFSAKSVLMLTDDKLDRRRKLTKDLLKRGTVVDCDRMDEANLRKWLTGRIRHAGKEAGSGVADRMIGRIGDSPASLEQAVEQLITYTGAEKKISPSDVDEALPAATFEEVWNLTNNMAVRDRAGCLKVIDNLMSLGEPIYTIIGAISWHTRQLLNAKHLMKSGIPEVHVFRKLHVFPSRYKQFRLQIKNFTLEQINRNISLLTGADFLAKTSGQTQHRLLLERTVLDMCKPKQ